MKGTISVIIPTYNVARFIAEAIESVLAQSRPPDEILVIDDCSTDGTPDVAKAIARSSGGRVRVFDMATNLGSAAARNYGLRAATGDYIALLDGDDLWLEPHLERVAGLLDRHPDAVLAYSPTEAFGAEQWVWPIAIPPDAPINCFWQCLPQTIIPQMNVVARRQALLDIGGYRPDMRQAQDYDLFLRLAFHHKFVCTHQVTTRYRRHAGSITMQRPNGGYHGVYLARYLFWKENQDRMTPDERVRLEQTLRQLWMRRLESSASRSNHAALDFHLSEHRLVPGSQAEYKRWQWRRRRDPLWLARQLLPQALRNLLRGRGWRKAS
jgi:glycosyltransferase involved in cell wall biosynthesis